MSLPRIPSDLRGRELWMMLARDQFGRGLDAEVDGLLLDMFKDVVRRILVDGPRLTPRQNDRLAEMFRSTSALLADKYGTISSTVTAALSGFSEVEAAVARQEIALRVGNVGELVANFQGPGAGRVISIAEVLLHGQRLPEWWQDQARRMSHEVRRQIQIGLTLGESERDIIKRIVPPKGSVEPSVYRRAQREASTLIRTATTAVGSQARLDELRRGDRRISDHYQWLAIRDARTTPICRALDGQVFSYDDPKAPVPPAHFNCRSTIIAVIKRDVLGIKEPKDAGPGGWKDYEAWLRAQPESLQRQILGAGRWDLWTSRKISLRDMVDADRNVLTLQQLRDLVLSRGPEPTLVALGARSDTVGPKDFLAKVDSVLEAIGRVHDVPSAGDRVHIRDERGKGRPGTLGEYHWPSGVVRVYTSQTEESTLVHELGHFLDARVFGGPGARPMDRPHLSGNLVQPVEWRQLWSAIRATKHYAYWKAEEDGPNSYGAYMLSPAELFARAYQQWIFYATPATDPLHQAMAPDIRTRQESDWLWRDRDFQPVAEAMEKIFEARGWRRSRT